MFCLCCTSLFSNLVEGSTEMKKEEIIILKLDFSVLWLEFNDKKSALMFPPSPLQSEVKNPSI